MTIQSGTSLSFFPSLSLSYKLYDIETFEFIGGIRKNKFYTLQ